jgi:hypothetical protein
MLHCNILLVAEIAINICILCRDVAMQFIARHTLLQLIQGDLHLFILYDQHKKTIIKFNLN